MELFEARRVFSDCVISNLSAQGFALKKASKGRGSGGYLTLLYILNDEVSYEIHLLFTSYLAINPKLTVYYKKVSDLMRKIDEDFLKTKGGYVFSSDFFEYFDKRNSDGYLNVVAGSPYFNIAEPFENDNIIDQANIFTEAIIIPVVNSVISKTNSLEKANRIINYDYAVKQDRGKFFSSLLVEFIPFQLSLSLLFDFLFKNQEVNIHLDNCVKYLNNYKNGSNSFITFLKKTISYISYPVAK